MSPCLFGCVRGVCGQQRPGTQCQLRPNSLYSNPVEGEKGAAVIMEKCSHLLDQHVKVLWYLRCKAYRIAKSLRQPYDQTEAYLLEEHDEIFAAKGHHPVSSRTGSSIPFDFRILRILFPTPRGQTSFRCALSSLELHTSNDFDLGNAMRVSQHNTNLTGRSALLGQLAYLVDNLFRRGLEPSRWCAGVRDGTS